MSRKKVRNDRAFSPRRAQRCSPVAIGARVKKREARRKVLVRARMRSGDAWGDVTIHNMSSRGLLAAADTDCRPGTVIEIRRVHHIIVGRVVWQSGGYFGVRTQDAIDMDGIVSAKPPAHKPGTVDTGDRRTAQRRTLPIADREARSRRFASGFQFVVLVLVIGVASLIVAQQVGGILSRPFATIGAHLDGSAGQEPPTNRP